MKLLFDAATEELRTWLAAELHAQHPPPKLNVRTLRADSNDVVIDVSKRHSTPEVDRFVLKYCHDTPGNRHADGVNLRERKAPTTITATAGTLNRTRVERTFASREAAHRWLCQVVNAPGACN
jgi:hypothetical protein